MKFQKRVLLKNYTTFKIGGRAKYFCAVQTKKDLIDAILMAKKLKLPFFILGNGSNLLVSDKGFDGIIIKVKSQKLKVKTTSQKSKMIEVESGVSLSQIAALALKNSLTGLEWAVGIPGTVGGAVAGNASAFQKSMADIVKNVEVFDATDLAFKIYNSRKCKFSYRDSIFKHKKNLIILSAVLQFEKDDKKKIKEKMQEYLNHRRQSQPLNFPSAGSVFKNPSGFFAGKLIQECGLKGKRIGHAEISEKHANFIVNLGEARAKDVRKLINLAKKAVKKQFKVALEEEIQFLGFK